MTELHPYSYTVLRYVHDAISGEFINAGIVLHIPAKQKVMVETRSTIGRIKGLFPDLDRTAFRVAMQSVERAVNARKKDLGPQLWSSNAGSLSRSATPSDDSAIQWSPMGSGLTDNPQKTLGRLMERFVARYDGKSTHRRSDDDVWRPVWDKISERGIEIPLEEKIVAGPNDEISFKHAWKNWAWHAYQPLSLDLADADGIKDKVRKWRGHLAAVAEGRADAPVKLHFIVGEPQNRALMPAFDAAVAILRHSDFSPEIIEESKIDDFVSRIEDEVRSHLEHVGNSSASSGRTI